MIRSARSFLFSFKPWILLPLLLLVGCAGTAHVASINTPIEEKNPSLHSNVPPVLAQIAKDPGDDTMVALAFSGGGMRASAFSYGVLKSLSKISPRSSPEKPLTESIDFISGVSGGSVTAAYFAWRGPKTFEEFPQRFLYRNAEDGMRTDFSVRNALRLVTFGGVNDRNDFPRWLDENVFLGATYADIFKKKKPFLWIAASDIYNRTPFVFSRVTFRPLCSDLLKIHLADSVSASAAVPGVFSPVNLESFANRCPWTPPPTMASTAPESPQSYAGKMIHQAFIEYRNPKEMRYIKLLDGGLTDNLGIKGISLMRLSDGVPYSPLDQKSALSVKNVLFLVVNAERGVSSDVRWTRSEQNPDLVQLASAVVDTAIDSNTHITFDFFQLIMAQWKKDLMTWRCAMPKSEVANLLGSRYKGWKCADINFYVTQISSEDLPSEQKKRFGAIPTRFVLPPQEVTFLINAAHTALQNNPTFRRFLARTSSPL